MISNKFNATKQIILIFAILFVFLTMASVCATDLPSFDGNNTTTVRNSTTVASTSVSDNKIIITSIDGSQ
ncbi:hypothetical protein [Methanobrevibacter curvatus]|uniref:Uncharacterized protein n=1 Tax=Methanobrevibacter curvatus TaxID=49547 RepID=A0A165ZPW6_9EURY|nr:hypothetical protein [Methanobrevibacter curvatus]KZX11006.1 hypothetical protein MBCUR_15920 [Methanobrevibacter curvatus]